ncbi:hypothetical protein BCR35DRAFT_303479, partial [Leucosporidium creatinivorum]
MCNPTLPPELLNLIIPLAIPPPSRASLRERTAILSSLSLVNSTWHAYAQPRLYSHLRLTDKRLKALAKELKQPSTEVEHAPNGSRALKARQVKMVTMGKWVDEYGAGLKTVLKEFEEVEEAYLEGTKEWGSLSAVAVLPSELETLHLTRVYNFLPPPHGFPLLRRLSLSFGLDKGIDWALLHPRNIPNLSHLILEPADWTFAQDPCFLSAFARIAPHLQALCLAGADQGGVDFGQLLRKAINLQHLYIHTTSDTLVNDLPSLPSALESLRISSTSASPETLATLLTREKEVPHSLATLKRLTVPNSTINGWDFPTKKSAEARKVIAQWCVKRGLSCASCPRVGCSWKIGCPMRWSSGWRIG